MFMFKCKERNFETMTGESCYQCFITRHPMDSRVICKKINGTTPADIPEGAIELSSAVKGATYRTVNDALVKVEEISGDKVKLYFKETGSRFEVPSNTIVFSDISKVLADKEKVGSGSKKQKRGETKTSYIDNLLSEGTEFNKIVELVVEKFKEDQKKIKRLVWSRRATLKKAENPNDTD